MKKILILGGSHRDIPLITASQQLGYFVITLGDRDYYLGHEYSNKAYKINFNDLDAVRKIIHEESISYLLPGSGEESYLNTVKLSNELNTGNFDTLDTAHLVHNKWRFKQFCLQNNISTPKGFFYEPTKEVKNIPFPVIVKPTGLSGGRGVSVAEDKIELLRSLEQAAGLSNEVFVEEFIDGKLIAYSVFLKDKKIIYGFLGEDITYLNKYLITTAYPTTISHSALTKLNSDIENLAALLNLVDGMFHLQVLVKNDMPYIIDVTRRIPGDLYPYLIEYCDGVKYSRAVVQAYIGEEVFAPLFKKSKSDFIIRHCVMPRNIGIYKGLVIDKTLEGKILYQLELIKPNTSVVSHLNTQLAIVFIKIDKSQRSILANINDLIYAKMTKGERK